MPIKITIKPSNKTQTLGKKTTEGTSEHPTTPPPQSDFLPFIDKLSLVLEPASDSEAYAIHNNIWAQFMDTNTFQSAGPEALKGWRRAKRIALNSTKHRPLLQYNWTGSKEETGKASRMRLDFNPRKLGAKGLAELDAVLTSLWDYGWDYVIQHGRITRIDVAVDIPNVRMDEFLFVPKQGASEIQWGQDGHLQSFRHGQPKGNQTVVYSVKQKRLAKDQPWSGPSVVRVERRLRNPSPYKLTELGKLANPFADMAMTTMPGPPPDEVQNNKVRMWSMFEDSVKARGVRAALALVPPDRRTKYRAYLKQHPQPWWNPDAIWANWPEVLVQLNIPSTKG